MARWTIFIIGMASLLSGCVLRGPGRSNVIVIAVEGLGFDTFSCDTSGNEASDGFGKFCAESVRFTHAYAPSTMSQASLASVLTGQTPSEHGLLHNGPLYLSEAIDTAAEVAVRKGYRTAFISGGPPIWRKSGLDQGFEVFEDNITVNLANLYRSASQNFDIFFKWFDREVSSEPMFAFLFLPDLQFPLSQTVTDLGEVRALGDESQLAEISESLAAFVDEMKNREMWDNSTIILLGTNGRIGAQRKDEIRPLNLHSENVQVALMVKPARREREESREWTIDANVSLVDVGATLRDLIGDSGLRSSQATSLVSALERPTITWPKDRVIPSESSWALWRSLGDTRSAFRQEQFLYLNDAKPQLYNTLTDRTESNSLSAGDTIGQPRFEALFRLNSKSRGTPWAAPSDFLVEKIKIASQLFNTREALTETILRLAFLAKVRPWEKQTVGWLATYYVDHKSWDELEDLGIQAKNEDWIYVAKIGKGSNILPPWKSCLSAILVKKPAVKSPCVDKEALALKTWVESSGNSRADAEEKFSRIYFRRKVEERIATLNYRNGLMWDTVLDLPGEPHPVDLAFALPSGKRFKASIDKRISRLASRE